VQPLVCSLLQITASELGGLRGLAKAEFEARDYLAGMIEKATASVQIFVNEASEVLAKGDPPSAIDLAAHLAAAKAAKKKKVGVCSFCVCPSSLLVADLLSSFRLWQGSKKKKGSKKRKGSKKGKKTSGKGSVCLPGSGQCLGVLLRSCCRVLRAAAEAESVRSQARQEHAESRRCCGCGGQGQTRSGTEASFVRSVTVATGCFSCLLCAVPRAL
jgi:hypothetical protein